MNGSSVTTVLSICEPVLCLVALFWILKRQAASSYKFLCVFLLWRICVAAFLVPLLFFAGHGVNAALAYNTYFKLYWVSFTVEAVLSLLIIYGIFDLAMAPLEGIRKLGTLVFQWVGCISVAVAVGSLLIPHRGQPFFLTEFVTQLQRTQSIVTLCMLLFVCFAIRPLGLSYKSRIFGVSLGLGVLATTNLIASAWLSHTKQMYSTINLVTGISTCLALLLWIGYFAVPESRRRIVVLPTTSPFLRWNQISQALGDAPGYVAVGGVPPELFAPAEIEVMRRASLQMAG